jgi:soluble lytic murein transglycosylase-like protein
LYRNRGWNAGLVVAAFVFVVATGSASAMYLAAGGESSAAKTVQAGATDTASTSTTGAGGETLAARSDVLPDLARDPNELEAAAASRAYLAAQEARAQAEVAARAQAEADAQARAQAEAEAAAAQLAAQQRAAAEQRQAEQARAAAAQQAAAQAAAAAGWPGDLLAKVERVVMCESGGRTNAVSPGGYVGLMQVAPWLHGGVPADADGQLAQAYQVYLQQGWGAWPVCGA